jgi:hypothetical protein
MERYCEVSLSADIMMINRIQFLITFLQNLWFGMSKALESSKQVTLLQCIKNAVVQLYWHGGFRVRHALMKKQFEPIHGVLAALGIMLNTTLNNEHVPKIEWYIYTVKECTCTISTHCLLSACLDEW